MPLLSPPRTPVLVRCLSDDGASSSAPPPSDAPPPPPKDAVREALAARMAQAKSYKQKQQELGQSFIVQAANTPVSEASASGMRPEMETAAREALRPAVECACPHRCPPTWPLAVALLASCLPHAVVSEPQPLSPVITRKGDTSYSPKTSTWGVFPRPADMSKAYGGGRNIEPGKPLESPEQAALRSSKVKAALDALRTSQGLDMTEEESSEAGMTLAEGVALFDAGALERAAEKFRRCSELPGAPFRSEVGGEARLQLALCLDSLGDPRSAEEVKELYTQCSRHPSSNVSKRAKRLLWGLTEASSFLKADSPEFDYAKKAGMRETYKGYLESQVRLFDVYTERRDEEALKEAAALNSAAALAMVALFGLPAGLLFALRSLAEQHRVLS